MGSWRGGALVFGASAAVLMLEIIAGRLMAPYVGVSLESFTGIIGTILAAIAVGAALGGSLADRRDPRALLGPALVLGGALSWASLPILAALGPSADPSPGAIVLLTTASFFAPATVLSAVPPMVAKLRLDDLHRTGSVVGGLSAAGTAGALAGTFLTGFVLVAALPSRPVVLLVGALLVLVGVVVHWRLRRGRPTLQGTAAVVLVGLAAVAFSPRCDLETAYFCVRVEVDPDRPSGRSLYLDLARHAHVDLEDPTYLDIRYVRLFAAVADELPEGPIDVLHLGGGGFTFPRYLRAVRPGSRQVVLEIDDELPRVAREQLGLREHPGIDIRLGDARLALDDLRTAAHDLVVGDAFASTSVPWHLTTVEVVEELHRVLRPGGLYVMNVIDGGANRYARAQLATLRATFDHVAVIEPADGVPADRAVNQVLLASDEPLPDLSLSAADGALVDDEEVARRLDGVDPLRDDHAPVDQLMFG